MSIRRRISIVAVGTQLSASLHLARRRYVCWWHQWSLRHLPAGMIVRGLEGFVGVLCAFVGAGILTAISEPPSAEQWMPDPLYALWGTSLTIGGFALTCGVFSIKWVTPPMVFVIQQLACYRLGLRLLASSTLLYGLAVCFVSGLNGAPAMVLTLYFSLTCVSRLLTLGRE